MRAFILIILFMSAFNSFAVIKVDRDYCLKTQNALEKVTDFAFKGLENGINKAMSIASNDHRKWVSIEITEMMKNMVDLYCKGEIEHAPVGLLEDAKDKISFEIAKMDGVNSVLKISKIEKKSINLSEKKLFCDDYRSKLQEDINDFCPDELCSNGSVQPIYINLFSVMSDGLCFDQRNHSLFMLKDNLNKKVKTYYFDFEHLGQNYSFELVNFQE